MKTLLVMLALTLTGPAFSRDFKINPARTIMIEGPIYASILATANELLELPGKERVDIIINSPGGSVYAGWQFINAMLIMQERGVHLRCTVTTMAASMAYQILAACDSRFAFKYSSLLWHPVRTGIRQAVTPRIAVQVAKALIQIESRLVADLRKTFDISNKLFFRHYHAETLHIGVDVQAMDSKFLTIVTDVGLKKFSRLKPLRGVGSTLPEDWNKYIYMKPEVLDLWRKAHQER